MSIARGSLALASDTNRTRGNKIVVADYAGVTKGNLIKVEDVTFRYTKWTAESNSNGSNPPASGTTYTWTWTENNTILKAQWDGQLSIQASNSNDVRIRMGFTMYVAPNSQVKLTWSANAGASWSDITIACPDYDTWHTYTPSAQTNKVTTFTTDSTGKFSIWMAHGAKSITTRWFSISKIEVAGQQVFPRP